MGWLEEWKRVKQGKTFRNARDFSEKWQAARVWFGLTGKARLFHGLPRWVLARLWEVRKWF